VPRIEGAPGLVWRPRKSGYEARWQEDLIRDQKFRSLRRAMNENKTREQTKSGT